MSNDPPLVDRLAALEAENASLKERLREIEQQAHVLLGGYGAAAGLAAMVVLGPGLMKATRAFFVTVGRGPFPRMELADLFAAVVRRVLTIGAIGLLVATVPIWLLYRQNELVEAQNIAILEQNAKIQTQIRNQEKNTRFVRRTELLTLLYEQEDCTLAALRRENAAAIEALEKPKEAGEWRVYQPDKFLELSYRRSRNLDKCPPKAPIRLREEAVIALADIDGTKLSLEEVDLSRADLFGAELPNADFSRADFTSASLTKANLSSADLSKADLSQAYLNETNFSEANLSGADLQGALILFSHFTEANLICASLHGTDLSNQHSLTQKQLNEACGDSETSIPDGLTRPSGWLDHPRDPETPEWYGCNHSACVNPF